MLEVLVPYAQNALYLGLFMFLFVIAKGIYNLTTPYDTQLEITANKNTALALSISGYLVALLFIYIAALSGPGAGWLWDILSVTGYALLGIGLLTLSRHVNDKAILHSTCNREQLIEKQNKATGIAQAASYVSSGLVIAAALCGEGDRFSALYYYAAGQLLLIAFTFGYDKLTRFCLQNEIKNGNIAAAVSYSATLIALSIILYHALSGDALSWQDTVQQVGIELICGIALLLVIRFLLDKLLLPGVHIDDAIANENNLAIALLDATAALCVALLILCIF